jgi:hypothetical protein
MRVWRDIVKKSALNFSMQDNPTEEMQNKKVKENNAERKRAMARNVREGFVRRNVLMP